MAFVRPADEVDFFLLGGPVSLPDLASCMSRAEWHSWSTPKEGTLSSVRLDDRFESVEPAMDRFYAVYGFALEQLVVVQTGFGSSLIQREIVFLLRGGIF